MAIRIVPCMVQGHVSLSAKGAKRQEDKGNSQHQEVAEEPRPARSEVHKQQQSKHPATARVKVDVLEGGSSAVGTPQSLLDKCLLDMHAFVQEPLLPTPANINTIHLPYDDLINLIRVQQWVQCQLRVSLPLLDGIFVLVCADKLPSDTAALQQAASNLCSSGSSGPGLDHAAAAVRAAVPWRLRQVQAVQLAPTLQPREAAVVLVGGACVTPADVCPVLLSDVPDHEYLCCELAALQQRGLLQQLTVFDVAHVAWRLRVASQLELLWVQDQPQQQANTADEGQQPADLLQQPCVAVALEVRTILRQLPPSDWVDTVLQYVELSPGAGANSLGQCQPQLQPQQHILLLQKAADAWHHYMQCKLAGQQQQQQQQQVGPASPNVPWAAMEGCQDGLQPQQTGDEPQHLAADGDGLQPGGTAAASVAAANKAKGKAAQHQQSGQSPQVPAYHAGAVLTTCQEDPAAAGADAGADSAVDVHKASAAAPQQQATRDQRPKVASGFQLPSCTKLESGHHKENKPAAGLVTAGTATEGAGNTAHAGLQHLRLLGPQQQQQQQEERVPGGSVTALGTSQQDKVQLQDAVKGSKGVDQDICPARHVKTTDGTRCGRMFVESSGNLTHSIPGCGHIGSSPTTQSTSSRAQGSDSRHNSSRGARGRSTYHSRSSSTGRHSSCSRSRSRRHNVSPSRGRTRTRTLHSRSRSRDWSCPPGSSRGWPECEPPDHADRCAPGQGLPDDFWPPLEDRFALALDDFALNLGDEIVQAGRPLPLRVVPALMPPLLADLVYDTPALTVEKVISDHLLEFGVLRTPGATTVDLLPRGHTRRLTRVCPYWLPAESRGCRFGSECFKRHDLPGCLPHAGW